MGLVDTTNQGRLDVIITNGHVNDDRPYYPYAMPSRLYANRPGKEGLKLVDISDQAGPPWQVPRVGRGLAVGDLDNDGRMDSLILPLNEPLAFFHNLTEHPGHFVTFRLEGTESNRDGVGARITVVAGPLRQITQRVGGASYQSAHDPRLHFGSVIDHALIPWKSAGRRDELTSGVTWPPIPAICYAKGPERHRPCQGSRAVVLTASDQASPWGWPPEFLSYQASPRACSSRASAPE